MTAPTPRAWLESRAAGVPPSLQARMLDAVGAAGATDEPLPMRLAAAALLCLADAAECGDDRAAALHLLAADALVTDACEAAAASAAWLASLVEACRIERLATDATLARAAAPDRTEPGT